jgi:hypothetical protein
MDKSVLDVMSINELDALQKDIQKVINKKKTEQFPYKVGECFCEPEPHSGGKAWTIVRIDEIDRQVGYTGIYINATLDKNMFNSHMSFEYFQQTYKNPIDPSVFDLFHENAKAIGELKSQFVEQVFKLRNDKRRTHSCNSSK